MSNYQTRLQESLNRVVRYISTDIWRIPLKDVPLGKTFLISQLRVLILALRGVREDKIHLRAPALTLISAFSVVPAQKGSCKRRWPVAKKCLTGCWI